MENNLIGLLEDKDTETWDKLISQATTTLPGKGCLCAAPAPIVQIQSPIGNIGTTFSKELLNQMIIRLKRNRSNLTHVIMSKKDIEDVEKWDETQVDEATQREIFVSGGTNAIWNVNFVVVEDLPQLLGDTNDYEHKDGYMQVFGIDANDAFTDKEYTEDSEPWEPRSIVMGVIDRG